MEVTLLSYSGSPSVWQSVDDFRNVRRRDGGLDKRLLSELRHVSSLAALYLIPFTAIYGSRGTAHFGEVRYCVTSLNGDGQGPDHLRKRRIWSSRS
jgi:hypothetical protein